ncbi:MAG: Hypoxanthine phosphoribosyltransferase [Chroococcidiopsis cubana SAG 39.79]|jgi:hypoxanthine phosphoribosyltransferase|uniref:Hypoxanthine phosphoribosyltransferase n=1 Tax=Chroococcidiopsis cubana SAG 39.79 TaxID=388085 RepID=A0AB37UHS2_9CYAN|nr:hypoxanthine phosphoribosyltransferase [Chroococcidiopsis cubana]MDZ4878555.1 Hypoxanthine phosphoribosyltransferase [Chroococcidiopsis cubana SAG 39.79]PSB65988.1 hypoxanthine phosphoribosyltransferase [Chroococcidiopsis cubana CCALA 043]RUT10925.1 hypoxanthine phosphoribosyltransferase [Chroococcidiopsis cubana SAG 39.79]
MNKKLVPLISQSEIAATVQRLARELDRDYQNRFPIVIGVLKGSFIFLADLIRQMQTPICNVELIRLSSYGCSTTSSGEVKMLMGLTEGVINNKDVILVEDIVDTGLSTSKAIEILKADNPSSLKLCALLDKPSRRKVQVEIDYLGIEIPDRFIVGYGIDMDEKYRQLPAIYAIEE